MVGVVVYGVLEAYFLTDADVRKDSNMQCTVIAHILDLVQEKLKKKGISMQRHMVVQADNTCREMRNQYTSFFGGKLIVCKQFDSLTYLYFIVGHTHAYNDQRLGCAAGVLAKAPLLETPAVR